MARIGITGHQNLTESCVRLVRQEILRELGAVERPIVGFSSLAAGADQIFAEAVLQVGGSLTAILPCAEYEESFADHSELRQFESLLSRASDTVHLAFAHPSEEAYWGAGQEIVNRSEILFAVWDGKPAEGLGGTGDVVRYARIQETALKVIWPDGCTRA